jgi:uncharacterized membrane protein
MGWLVLGVLVWTSAHYFKRIAPGVRAAMGNAGKGLVAVLSIGAIVLMVLGYKAAEVVPLWDLGGWAVHVNNALMLIAVVFVGVGGSKSRLREKMRHPMLIGVLVWMVAHLLVNGDLASLVLFGGLGLWALGSIYLINRDEPEYEGWQGGSQAGDIRLLIISIVVIAVIMGIHFFVGPSPFPGRSV